MMVVKLALRNLWRNRRRTLATLLSVAVGFTAVNLFGGYIHDVYRGLRHGAIHGEGLGHLMLARRGYFDEGELHPERFSLKADEVRRLLDTLRATPGVRLAAPRLSLSGLVSNGRLSTIFIAEGQTPESLRALWGAADRRRLDAARPEGVLMSAGLARLLGIGPGQTAVALSSTLEGQTNALDLQVLGTFDTGNAGSNDKTMILSLDHARRLLDTEGASRVVVLLDEEADADAVRARLLPALHRAGFDVEARTWMEQSAFYRQVKNLFDLIFLFLFSIVFVVVLMSIVNTLTMSVMERVREIGTLRALGATRAGVVRLFAVEGGVLGACGCLAGAALTLLVGGAVNGAGLSYVPPAASGTVPLTIALSPGLLLGVGLVLSLVAMIAALVPARHAGRIEIVGALGHV